MRLNWIILLSFRLFFYQLFSVVHTRGKKHTCFNVRSATARVVVLGPSRRYIKGFAVLKCSLSHFILLQIHKRLPSLFFVFDVLIWSHSFLYNIFFVTSWSGNSRASPEFTRQFQMLFGCCIIASFPLYYYPTF